jgi:hypothetical protein
LAAGEAEGLAVDVKTRRLVAVAERFRGNFVSSHLRCCCGKSVPIAGVEDGLLSFHRDTEVALVDFRVMEAADQDSVRQLGLPAVDPVLSGYLDRRRRRASTVLARNSRSSKTTDPPHSEDQSPIDSSTLGS